MATRETSARRVGGRYRLDRLIGRGGAGAVWRGHDERLHRPVAVKEISYPADGPQAEVGQVRALREARAAARLGDAGVVQIYDIFEEGGSAYLIMELVDAPNLSVLVRRAGPLRPRTVATLGIHMLDSLAAAHRAGIVHRDVKPSNVLIDGGVPRLTDFGIARLGDESTITTSGAVMGTPAYIAPEHAVGEAVGPPADLYGLGATLYYAVEGTAPFGERSPVATVMAVLERPPRPPRRAGALTELLDDLLAKDPAVRPVAADVRERLAAIADEEPTATAAAVVTSPGHEAPASADDLAADTDEVARREMATTSGGGTSGGAHSDAPVDITAGGGADGATPDVLVDTTVGGGGDGATRDEPADTIESTAAERTREAAAVADRDAGAGAPPVVADDDERPRARRAAPAPARPGTRRRPYAFGVVVLIVLTALAALALRSDDGDNGQRRDDQAQGAAGGVAPAASSAASPSTGEPAAGPAAERGGVLPAYDVEVPDDWVVLAPDDAPYRVAHPPGWRVVAVDGSRTDIRDPGTGTYLRLDWVAARRDPVAAWETFEPTFAAQHDRYRRLQLEPTTYKGDPAALWEYRYRSDRAVLRAYNLGVNTGEFGFALNLQARQRNFAEARRLWPYFLASYEFTGG